MNPNQVMYFDAKFDDGDDAYVWRLHRSFAQTLKERHYADEPLFENRIVNGEETRSKFTIDDHRIMPYETPASLGAALAWRLNANEIRVVDATDEVPQSSKDHQHHTRAALAHKYLECNPRLRANNNELILAHFEVADDDHRLIYYYGYGFRNGVIGKRFTARLWNNGVGPGRVYIAVDIYFGSSSALNGQVP